MAKAEPTNLLYYGDNLDVLRRYVTVESVDLVYLDPPFNSNADYNAFFAEQDGSRSAAQIKAFEDTWRWDQAAASALHDFVEDPDVPDRAKQALLAFQSLLGHSNMLAYLAMMAPRLVELWRALKPTGSLYLHCDPTASHYLKLMLDAIFDPTNFRSEIVWKRSTSHGNVSRNYGDLSDSIFFYAKTQKYKWNQQYKAFSEDYIRQKFRNADPDGRRYQDVTLRNPGVRPNLHYPFTASNGITYHPHPNGWSCDIERMKKYDSENRLRFPSKEGGQLRLKMYLDENPGTRMQNLWDDIPAINSQAAERLGYPTQKPLALLERIILASSDEGDTVLDPFCGCGTTVAAAQKLNRRWVGIDVTSLATSLIKNRLLESYGKTIVGTYKVVGEPTVVEEAERLASDDPYQFQWWALGLVGARPIEQKKGADRGVDGRLYFHDEGRASAATKQVVFSVKAGRNIGVAMVRDLGHVVDREKTQIGVLLTMHEPTGPMRAEAAGAGFYVPPAQSEFKCPKLQILTVADLLDGRQVALPRGVEFRTFKKAPKVKAASRDSAQSFSFPDDEAGEE